MIQLGSFTETLWSQYRYLPLHRPLSLPYKDLSLPRLPSPQGEEGPPNMTMGIWWEKFHRNYVGSENGEGKLGKRQGELTQGQNPRQSWPAYVLTNRMTWGPK